MRGISLSDAAFRSISTYLLIAVHRVRTGRELVGDETPDEDEGFAADLARIVTQRCAVTLNFSERNYLGGVILS
ncbi:hypothetical protein [Olsenella sp. HMSC062G07]|uniref:hypothetical protein n=1 Tax=Olsenella sp. HMSC062G07 TaxID=1739330 RepID=UPI0008A2BED6|nr:hypothetical protein [Olsenella sp. HMSC062G07]OFK23407.1 hypothetical protein HMPREF2826_04815 [Olsenella sp. HMSC062G07]